MATTLRKFLSYLILGKNVNIFTTQSVFCVQTTLVL